MDEKLVMHKYSEFTQRNKCRCEGGSTKGCLLTGAKFKIHIKDMKTKSRRKRNLIKLQMTT